MYDHILIYVIVVLNALCQTMLIWRLKHLGGMRWPLLSSTVLLPFLISATMRLLVAAGIIHGNLTEQTYMEQVLTRMTGMLLIAGPWLVTASAVLINRNRKLESRTTVTP